MDAFAGIVDFERTPQARAVRAMLDAVGEGGHSRRGIGGTGDVVLGVQAGTVGQGVLACASSGDLWVAFNGRLHNRAALHRRLRSALRAVRPVAPVGARSSSNREDETLSDAALILALYRQEGPQGIAQLRGDFAFALWDAPAQRLVGARDHAGVYPFFYHVGADRRITFGSMLQSVLHADEGPRRTNPTRMGDFLAGIPADPEATFFAEVQRLPPAHLLIATPEGVRTETYWSMDAVEPASGRSDAACVEAFQAAFTRAVRRRLPHESAGGAFLSGGLDSSSIVVAADAQQAAEAPPLHIFSAVYDALPECDERPYIRQVLGQGSYTAHFIRGEKQQPLITLRRLIDLHHEPFFAPNMGVSWLLYQAVAQSEADAILHGHGGDEVVSKGYGRLKELAQAGQWYRLARELRGLMRGTEEAWYRLFTRYVERYALHPAAERSIWARVARAGLHRVRQWTDGTSSEGPTLWDWDAWVHPDFARAVDLRQRVEQARSRDPRAADTEAERHRRILAGPGQAYALEAIARLGRSFGVETAFPFWDRDLVECCLALPSDQKLRDGWGRYVLRRSMEGALPPAVQWRQDKTDFLPNLRHGLQREQDQMNALFLDGEAVAKEYIQMPVLEDLRIRFVEDPASCSAGELFLLWKAAVLIAWLHNVR